MWEGIVVCGCVQIDIIIESGIVRYVVGYCCLWVELTTWKFFEKSDFLGGKSGKMDL
jgi:hypothetical protein